MTSNFDPCGTPESAGGCATCPQASQCIPAPEPTLEELLDMEEGQFIDSFETPVVVVDGADGLTPDMLRRRIPERIVLEKTSAAQAHFDSIMDGLDRSEGGRGRW